MSLSRPQLAAATGPGLAAALGGLATDPGSRWFRRLDKPAWYPPPQTFGIVWSALYVTIGWAAVRVLGHRGPAARSFGRAYAGNLVLNAAWTPLFFRVQRPWWATAEAAALAASSADLVRRASGVDRPAAAALVPYAAWTAFATALSGSIARRNPR